MPSWRLHEKWCDILGIDFDACRYANELVDGGMICVKPIELFGIKMPDYGYIAEACWNPFQFSDLGILTQFRAYIETIIGNLDPQMRKHFLQALALHAIMDLIEHKGRWWGYDREGFRSICERLMNRFEAIQLQILSNAVAELCSRIEDYGLLNAMIKDILSEKSVPTSLVVLPSPREIQQLLSQISQLVKSKGRGSLFVVVNGWGPVPAGAPAVNRIHGLLSRGICIEFRILVGTFRWNFSKLEELHRGYYCDLLTLREDLEKLITELQRS